MNLIDNFEDIFENYRDTTETIGSLFTIIIHNSDVSKAVLAIQHRLKLASEMRQSKKKTTVCQRLSHFNEYLGKLETDFQLNSVFLISDKINEISLTKSWISVLSEYDIETFIFKYGSHFEIDYLKNLLTDFDFKDIMHVKNNEYTHFVLNSTKKKIRFEKESKNFDLADYIQKNIKDKCVIHGVSAILKFFKCDPHWVFNKKLTDDEILSIFRNEEVSQIHIELEKYMAMIKNEKLMHRIVFGKDIEKRIMEKTLQTLYCSPEIHKKIMKKLPQEYFTTNFHIYKVESLTKGDVADRLKTDFSGALGITYY
jgi:hypothetical protein